MCCRTAGPTVEKQNAQHTAHQRCTNATCQLEQTITVFNRMQDKVLLLNLELNYVGHLEFTYETGPSESNQAEPKQGLHHQITLTFVLFWDITQRRVVIPYRCFRATYLSHFQESRNPKQIKLHDWGWHNLLGTLWTVYTELFSVNRHHRNCNLIRYAAEIKSSPWVVTGKWLLKN